MSESLWESTAWSYRDEEHRELSDAFLLWNRDRALRNLDLSLAHFQTLDVEEFEHALDAVRAKAKSLKSVEDLSVWKGVEGVYVTVFDGYKQFYVGKANDISARIRQHWSGRKPFDRLVFGDPYGSVLPVDELRQLDTTRMFAARSRNPFGIEERLERVADQRFTLNRMAGGRAGPLELMLLGVPRSRAHHPGATSSTQADLVAAWGRVESLVAESRSSGADPVPLLAALDKDVRARRRDDGSTRFWSLRDLVADAFAFDGLISAAEFEAFLGLMGENVVWPDPSRR
jgi:hypothetical protein